MHRVLWFAQKYGKKIPHPIRKSDAALWTGPEVDPDSF